MSEPSIKQCILAEKIANKLEKPLPKEYTSKAYYYYIKENIDMYRLSGCNSTQEEAEAFDGFQY